MRKYGKQQPFKVFSTSDYKYCFTNQLVFMILNMSDTIFFFRRSFQVRIATYVATKTRTKTKEYKEEAQCAQKGGRMLVFVICGFIKHFFPNFYFIFQIHHVKRFKMIHVTSLYFNFSLRFS